MSAPGTLTVPNSAVVPQPQTLHQMLVNDATRQPFTGQSPTIQVGAGAGNGSGGSATIAANNTCSGALVTINTGSANNSTNAIAAYVAFPAAFAAPPIVTLASANAAAATIAVADQVYVVASTTGIAVNTSGGALNNSTTYQWYIGWQG